MPKAMSMIPVTTPMKETDQFRSTISRMPSTQNATDVTI